MPEHMMIRMIRDDSDATLSNFDRQLSVLHCGSKYVSILSSETRNKQPFSGNQKPYAKIFALSSPLPKKINKNPSCMP